MRYKNNIDYIENLKNYVAKVVVYDDNKEKIAFGTAFFLSENTLITAHHVVADGVGSDYEVRVKYYSHGTEFELLAEVVHSNPHSDVNLLHIFEPVNFDEEADFPKITRNAYLKREFQYASFGFPSIKATGHYQQGTILDFHVCRNNDKIIDVSLGEGRLDNYIGFSGSPVVCNGQLIGIAIEQTTGLNRSQSIQVLNLDSLEGFIDTCYYCEDTYVNGIIYAFIQESQNEIDRNKTNKKYIPNIYVEIDKTKDYLRSFSDPISFFKKHLEYNKKHSFTYFNRLLSIYGLKEIESIGESYDIELKNLTSIAESVIAKLDNSLEYINKLSDFSSIKKEVPAEKLELFEISYYTRPSLLRYEIRNRKSLFEAIKHRQVLLTEKAGQGKTNLLCDFTENVLLKKEIPCFFVGARNILDSDMEITMLSITNQKIDIDHLLEVLNFHAHKLQKPFIIVIDAINELENINESKHKLYVFLNKIEKYEYIRVLLTARTEYFNEKFGDLIEKCPSINHIDRYNWGSQSPKYRKRIYRGYMQHFNIEINDIDNDIYNQLTEDFLLLRMFSEAYQGTHKKINAIPSLQHLFRYEIFERYYDYKIQNLQEWDRAKGIIDNNSTYDLLMKSITSYMINHMVFSNIDRSLIVGEIENELLVKLIDEDIVFREDIQKKIGVIEKRTEVINFTFDEFRDFCLAKSILENFDETNMGTSEKLISKLTSTELEIAEGVQKYLFFANMKYPNEKFGKILERQDWFKRVYTNNIFSVDDEYITEKDVSLITNHLTTEKLLNISDSLNAYVVNNLFKRMNVNVYKNFNIKMLNMILQSIDRSCFDQYFRPIFEPTYKDRYYSYTRNGNHLPIDMIVQSLKRKMKSTLNRECVVLLSILDSYHIYADNFFEWCIDEHPLEFISITESILESGDDIEIEAIKRIVRNLSYYIVNNDDVLQQRWESIQEQCIKKITPYDFEKYPKVN